MRRGGALGCTARQYIIYTCAQPRRLLQGAWSRMKESSGPRIDTRMLQPQLYASRCLSHLHHQPAAAVRTNTINRCCVHQSITPSITVPICVVPPAGSCWLPLVVGRCMGGPLVASSQLASPVAALLLPSVAVGRPCQRTTALALRSQTGGIHCASAFLSQLSHPSGNAVQFIGSPDHPHP
jgi:hypothetical protein